MLSLTLSYCADALIFAFFPLLSKHQWRLLWEEMSTAPKRPRWICQWRAAEILLAVLVQFCAPVQANTRSEPACSSCSVLAQPWRTWKTTCVHRWLHGSLSTAQRRAVMLRRENMVHSFALKAGRNHRSSQKHVSHHQLTSSISLGTIKWLLTAAELMAGLCLCTTALLCSALLTWAAINDNH